MNEREPSDVVPCFNPLPSPVPHLGFNPRPREAGDESRQSSLFYHFVSIHARAKRATMLLGIGSL